MKKELIFLLIIMTCGITGIKSQTIETYSGEKNFGGVIGVETYEYYLKDSIRIKHGNYSFEATVYPAGVENKSKDQQRVKVGGKFSNNTIEGKWIETSVGLSDGLPYKQYFQASMLNGMPIGQWISTDTTKSKDGIYSEYNTFTIKDGKISGRISYKNSYRNTWTNIDFDESGLINCCGYVHGFYERNYRNDVDPGLGIYYHKDDDEVYIVWNKFYINIFDKESSNLPDYPLLLERFQNRFQVFTYFIGEEIPLENFTFKIGYNYAEANQIEIEKWLGTITNTSNEPLGLTYIELLKGMNAYKNDDYYEARDHFIEAQKLCKECKLKEVIGSKLVKTKSLLFE